MECYGTCMLYLCTRIRRKFFVPLEWNEHERIDMTTSYIAIILMLLGTDSFSFAKLPEGTGQDDTFRLS